MRMLKSVKTVDAESDFLIADELELRVDSYGQNIAFISIFQAQNMWSWMSKWLNNGLWRRTVLKVSQRFGRPLAMCQAMQVLTPRSRICVLIAPINDRMMMVLPMYHATGGLVGCGAVLTNGGAVIIIPKFSASRFWDDAVKYGATMFTYVGELCRFLLSQPPTEAERKHKISWVFGNGLRPEVWESFVSRFDIPHVIEFYGATEGNVSFLISTSSVLMLNLAKTHAAPMGSAYAKIQMKRVR